MNKVDKFYEWCLKQEGCPYVWPTAENKYSGKGLAGALFPDSFDCSGLVTAAMHAVGGPDWRADHNCNAIFAATEDTKEPEKGDFVLYGVGRNMLTHIMIWAGDGRVFGSSGGNHYTVSPVLAMKIGARVRFHGSHLYRPDFVGFKKNPLRSK